MPKQKEVESERISSFTKSGVHACFVLCGVVFVCLFAFLLKGPSWKRIQGTNISQQIRF